jgi:biopolymer transport protein ExbD
VKIGIGRRPDPVVDLTPMIDVVFQLVLFFMVSTTFRTSPAIQVDLPRSTQDLVVADREDLFVWMTLDGALYLNESPIGVEGLRQAFRTSAESGGESLVIIKADRGVEHGRVVGVMDLARSQGLARLAIATEAGPSDLDDR